MTGPVRRWKAGLVGLLLLGIAGVVAAAVWLRPRKDAAPPLVPEFKLLLSRAVSVAPGVYLLGKTTPAVAYAVETSEGLVLIDSGLEADAEALTAQLAELHLNVGSLRAILLTHVHADHSLGAEYLRARTGAQVYAGRADCLPLRQGGPREAFFSTFHMPQVATHATTVDVELAGEETLAFGQTRFRAIATPGHTPGSVCYLLERPDLRALFTGDVVQCLTPANGGDLGTYAAYLPPLYRGDARDYLASLHRLRALPLPDLVLPGHPQMDPTPQSPHVTAEHWRNLMDRGIADMERLLARYESDGADFLDGTPKELLPGLHYLGSFGRAVYCLSDSTRLFLFDAPGGPMLVDFLARRLRKAGLAERKPTVVLLTSADEEATAGLAELVRNTGCSVVAPKAGSDEVRRLCPAGTKVLTEDDFEKQSWFSGRAIPLAGRGKAPLAYRLVWAGKTVLISGRIPVKWSGPTMELLHREITGPEGNVKSYLQSLDRLAQVRPDLWLPAVPVHGQNANLYDDDWAKVLRQNREIFP